MEGSNIARTAEKSPADLYQEREKRIEDAIALKLPDRVPVTPSFGFFATKYYGITYKEAMYEGSKNGGGMGKDNNRFSTGYL